MKEINLLMGESEFCFQVSNVEYNKFVDRTSSGKPIQAGFNLLSSTVMQEQRAALRAQISDKEGQPKAMVVMALVGEISEAFGEGLPEVVKLQKSSATSADEIA